MSTLTFQVGHAQNIKEMDLAGRLADELVKAYPGYAWAVNVEGSVINVQNLSLSGRWGFTLHTAKLPADYRPVMIKAGGELLERFRQPRGKADMAQLINAPRDFKGDHACDAS